MPNKPHAPRGGLSKKTPASASNAVAAESVDGGSKKKKKSANWWEEPDEPDGDVKKSGKKKQDQSKTGTADIEAVKKTDVRTIIGGTSWTGKLPVNMLSELCQKQKWCKPDYNMRKIDKDYVGSVILSYKEPKSGVITSLPQIQYPKDRWQEVAQPTALEARHLAAAYTLFRLCSMKNIHMMMPPKYRDLWKGPFADIKKADIAVGNGWMYEADPFAAAIQRDADEKARIKRLEADRLAKEKRDQPGSLLSMRSKAWDRACGVELGKRTRFEVESLVREHTIWNEHETSIQTVAQNSIIKELTKLGFRQSHVQEAVHICKDRKEVLEWLITHVPEDDLPRWCLPENYTPGVSMAASDLGKEAIINRLCSAGYSRDLCESVFSQYRGQERNVASKLQSWLLGEPDSTSSLAVATKADSAGDDAWTEEQQVLSSIFGERYNVLSETSCRILCQTNDTATTLMVEAAAPLAPYPGTLPIIRISGKLPAYIRLSITKQVLQHASTSLLGEPMLFNIVDWVEQNADAIIASPGRLSAVASAAGADSAREASLKPEHKRSLHPKRLNTAAGTTESKAMLAALDKFRKDPISRKLLDAREALPAWSVRQDVVSSVSKNLVTIISGETGSGKSTQSVQFILDDLIEQGRGEGVNILCTQPRRISAIGLADRVSEERASRLGTEIGYIIRGESKIKRGATKITFMTTGILLRRLQTSGGSEDDLVAALADVSHIFIDEVHERGVDVDFLFALLKLVLSKNSDLRLVLMSATIDAEVFEQYFSSLGPVGRVHVKGRTFPVVDYYKDDLLRQMGLTELIEAADDGNATDEDTKSLSAALRDTGMGINYDLIACAVEHIDDRLGSLEGGILIFLPGTAEIDRTIEAVRRKGLFHALPLHASLPAAEQRRVFPPAPKGRRKVIAATNVAETSITIPDIIAVIDTGRVKETAYDPKSKIQRLTEVWASRAACAQRRGRAGRVREGICYKLFTRNMEQRMQERPDPEITRIPLEQLCLSVKGMGVQDVSKFLSSVLTPPASPVVDSALQLLTRIGALEDGQLTALGKHLAMIPADLRCAKLLVMGSTFGCMDACLSIAALLTSRSPFFNPRDKRDEVKSIRFDLAPGQGDFIADYQAYDQWDKLSQTRSPRELRSWCDEKFVNMQTMREIQSNRSQFVSALQEIGFLPLHYPKTDSSRQFNVHNDDPALVKGLLTASLHPNILSITFPATKFAASHTGALALDPEARTIKFYSEDGSRAFVHPSSICFEAKGWSSDIRFLTFWERFASGQGNETKPYARGVTPTNAMSVLLFGGPISVDTLGRGMVVDGWIKVRGWARIGVLIARMRRLLDNVLDRKIENPQGELRQHEKTILDVVRKLVARDGMDH